MLIYTLLLLAHLFAAVIWVGGMAMAHFIVRPVVMAQLEPPQRLVFMAALLQRFFGWVSVAIVLLWLTGLAMVEVAGGMAVVHRSIHLMLGLALVMTLIYAYIRWRPYPGLQRAVAARAWPAAGQQMSRIRVLVLVNLLIGVLTFGVIVLGRVLM